MKYAHINLTRKTIASAIAMVISQLALAQSPQIKVDLNMGGRPEPEVNEPGYLPWAIETANSVSQTFSGVKVTFSKQSSSGTALRATWFKAGVQAPYLARLANDGIYIDGGEAGAAILMRLEGLPVGQHSLLVYLNSIADPTKDTIAPIDISLDGKQIVDNFKPSVRVTNNADAASAYLTFTTTTGKADFLFKADTSTGASNKNVVINAFELNTPNVIDQSSTPVPERGDLHIDAPDGKYTLGWRAAASATRHHVYLGTKESDVANATQTSATYKGARTTTTYPVSNLSTSTTYYWRVDEEKAGGIITKGTVWSFRPRLLAYPGAEGYGRFAIGGRGGKVVKVTNLNDDGAGSLRYAVENDIGPRTIVFDVSGIITLNSRLTLNSNFVTVAGQTAPGKGIVVRGAPFGTSGVSDVIFQNMRVRVGGGITYDGTGMAGANHSIMDRCSISWSMDEAFSSRGAKNITLQRSMLSEALNVAGHQNYPAGTAHGYAGTISGLTGSFHHNLLAHNEGRNFSMGAAIDGANTFVSRLDIFNNVVYNWGGRATDGQVHKANFVNNYYKKGAATSLNYAFTMDLENYGIGTMQAYYSGNILQNTNGSFQCDGKDNSCGRRYRLSNGNPEPTWNVFPSSPLFSSYANIQTAKQAFKTVLSDVGTNQPMLDTHDTRIVNETLNGTYTYKGSKSGKPGLPDHQNDVGGYESYPTTYRANDWDSDNDGLPNWWETWYRLNPNSAANNFSDANNDDDRDGYTQLEKYLQWKSNLHYNIAHNQTASINLRDAFRGYTLSPRYAATDIINGKVTISGNTAVFTPNGCGLASFNIQVMDSEGDSMTRPVGVFTESANPGMCVGTDEGPGNSSSSSSSNSSTPASSSLAAISSSSSSAPVLSSSSLPSSSVVSSVKSSSSTPSSSLRSSSSSSLIASSKSSSSIASSVAANNCKYVVADDWGAGFVAAIRIKNNRTTVINNWSVNWTYSDGSRVTNSWNANVTGSNPYNATNMSYNGSIQPGQTIEFGFQGTKNSGAVVTPIITGSVCN